MPPTCAWVHRQRCLQHPLVDCGRHHLCSLSHRRRCSSPRPPQPPMPCAAALTAAPAAAHAAAPAAAPAAAARQPASGPRSCTPHHRPPCAVWLHRGADGHVPRRQPRRRQELLPGAQGRLLHCRHGSRRRCGARAPSPTLLTSRRRSMR